MGIKKKTEFCKKPAAPRIGRIHVRQLALAEITLMGTDPYTTADLRATVQTLYRGGFGDPSWVEERPLAEGAHAFRDLHEGR